MTMYGYVQFQHFRKFEVRRPPVRARRRFEHNVQVNVIETRCEVVDWIHLTQNRGPMAYFCKHDNEPSGSIKGWKYLD
jgi:hypothetical protein